jgi:hypothetical protein
MMKRRDPKKGALKVEKITCEGDTSTAFYHCFDRVRGENHLKSAIRQYCKQRNKTPFQAVDELLHAFSLVMLDEDTSERALAWVIETRRALAIRERAFWPDPASADGDI